MNIYQKNTRQRSRPFGRLLCLVLIVLILVSGILPVAKAAASITNLSNLKKIGNHTVDTVTYPVYQYTVTSTEDQLTFEVSDTKCKLLSKKPVIGEKWSKFTPAYGELLRSETEEFSVASSLYTSLGFDAAITNTLEGDTSKTAFFIATRTAGPAPRAKVASIDGILIVEWEEAVKLDDSSIKTATAKADALKSAYYQSDDRYNGKTSIASLVKTLKANATIQKDTATLSILNQEANVSSFGALYRAAFARADALYPSTNGERNAASNATQDGLDAAAALLDAAVDNLIFTDTLNTTPLYEALQEVNSLGYNDLSLKAYTETSAAKFKEGRAEAQAYLDSLFTGEDGNRKPSDANKKENQTTFDTAATKARALPTLLVHQSLVSYSEQNTKTILALAARYGAGENPGYTEESWSALQSARTDALAYIKAHPVTDRLTKDENRGLREKANTLWNAICALKSTKEQISVTLTYTDDYHLRLPSSKLADKSGLTPGSKNYELTSDSTLYNLLTTAGFTSPNGGSASDKYPGLASDADALRRYGWSIRVNGVQQTTGLIGDQAITNFMGQLLHDGDQVQIALFEVPTRAFNYIYREELDYWGQLPGVLGSLRFAGGSSTSAEAGAELSLTVEGAKTAHVWSYNGGYTPYEGAKIAVYGPKTEAGYPAKATIFDAVTDAEGKTSILLYEEGTYLVTAFEPRENDESTSTFYSGMMAAPYLEVKVGKASDEDGVKAKLKAELDAVYNAYPQEQFGAAAWEQLKAAYDKAVKVLNKTDSTVAEARAAQQTAIAAIQKLQNEMLGDNQDSLSRFRKYLAMLPDDTGEITSAESIQDAIEQMKAAYASLNSYQKSLLTGPEEQKYEKIIEFMEKNGDKLPSAKTYGLKLVVEGDDEASTEILNAMYAYLRENPAKQDRGPGGVGDATTAINVATPFTFGSYVESELVNGKPTQVEAFRTTFSEATPLTTVRIFTGLNNAAYFQLRNANGTFSPDGAKWSLCDKNLIYTELIIPNTGTTSGKSIEGYKVNGDLVVLIDGTPYELKSITYSGISKSDITSDTYQIYDVSEYKGKDPQAINMKFDNAYAEFAMPYEDVTITISWAKAEKLDQTKKAAEKAVLAEFNAYNEADYTAENWTKLVAVKDAGLDAIEKAENAAAVTTARKAAINAMAAIPTKDQSGTTGAVGGKYPFKDAKVVGRVHVIVENTTFESETLPTELKGKFINDWYDLTEDDSMMTVILKALEGKKYHWQGGADDYDISYLASVEWDKTRLAEFTGGGNSGWMGTLNDWFVNKGFTSFRASDGSLQDGDYIHVMYTTALGADLGGSWSNTSTTLKSLNVRGGTLSPASLSSGVTDYVLQITESDATVTVSYEPTNKNYQARMYLNNYNNENSRYVSGSRMQVTSGDIIYIGVGEAGWPSMNEASPATRYTIRVVIQGNLEDLQAIIARLPAASKLTLADAEDVETAYSLYQALGEDQKADFGSPNYNKLMACYKRLPILRAVSKVTTAANKLPQNPANLTLSDKQLVADAQGALDELTKLGAANEVSAAMRKKITDATAKISQLEVDRVKALINALPDPITEAERAQFDEAEAAFNALNDEQQDAVGVNAYQKLLKAKEQLKASETPSDPADWKTPYRKTQTYLKSAVPNPTVNSVKGEWAIIGLARSDASMSTNYYSSYYDRVVAYVDRNINAYGQLHTVKSTENARVALAVTAIGKDPRNVGGHNLLTALNDVTYVNQQGVNGPIWALLALDSKNYDAPGREELITSILGQQFEDGGWAVTPEGSTPATTADVDMTAMAIQALAPYYNTREDVTDAVNKALVCLSGKQLEDGRFQSWGTTNSESAAQVVVALSALGIDADKDTRFVKSGNSALDGLLSFAVKTGGFGHDDNVVNQMATEQAYYALAAYDRFDRKANRLYDMSDVVPMEDVDAQGVIALINNIGYVDEYSYNRIADARSAYDNLSAADKAKVTNYSILEDAEDAYKTILRKKQSERYKELKAHYDDLLNDKTKKYGTAAKKKLASILQQAQTDMNAAVSCERVEEIFQKAMSDLDAVKPGDIEVTFRLIGALEATQDVNLTSDSYLPEYVTWVPTKTYALQENATVYDLFTEAMKDAGLRYIGAESNYVSTIYAPSCLGGYALSEFTNGTRSGWMYTVNGTHVNKGLQYWTLNDGDVVIWHYVNDYAHEVADWFDDPNYPSLGNGTYYNGWLRAADISPEQYVNELLGKILKVGKNGTVEPKLTFQHIGKSVTFTFKPDTGYKVKDVKVNGKSVGAVKTYTIDKLTVSTRIEVEFADGKLPFTDVHETDWFYEDVAFAYENGLFAGTSDTTFSPNASMTRAMLVTVLYRLEGQPAVNGRSGFSDVQYNGYYEDAVTWAADNGIVNGTSTTTFSPNANVTREQMAAILYRYAQHKKYNTAASSGLNGFTDYASVSGYAAASLEWAVAEKLVNGSAGKLMPTGNATRAQVAAILHRFVENVAKTTK